MVYPNLLEYVHDRPAPNGVVDELSFLLDVVVQPYNADEFERKLEKHNLTQSYPQLVQHLCDGFPLGRMPKLDRTIIIPNNRTVLEEPETVREYLATELAAGRMLGPFSQEEMERICRGPFHCSPSIVSTHEQGPGLPPKKRVCRHLSKADGNSGTPAVNNFVDKSDFPTKFDMPAKMAELVSRTFISF